MGIVRWIVALHNRTPLFIKVLGVNGLFVVVGALGGYLIARYGLSGSDVVVFILMGLASSLIINLVLLRLAFWPLFRLQQVMDAVRAGDFRARSPSISGDPDVRRLAETFNLVLDRLEQHRQAVSSQVLGALEEERKRIARELHDETSQALTTILITLEMAEQSLPPGDRARERVSFARQYTLQTLEEIRRLTYDLRPSILDDLGLVPAIRWYLKHRLAAAGLTVDLEVDPTLEEVRLPEEKEVTVFRIVQEALTNVRKHSRASAVQVRLWLEPGRLLAQVRDNGRGFDPAQASQSGGGLGLVGMRERASLVGAHLHIASAPGRGTAVTLEVPLSYARQPQDQGAAG